MSNDNTFIKRELATLRRLKGRQRMHYIWDYYKVPIFALALVVLLIAASALFWSDNKRTALSVVLVNAYQETAGTDPLFAELLAASGKDPEQEQIEVDANFKLRFDGATEEDGYTIQALAALFGMGGMDVFVANKEAFDPYVEKDGFENLELWLPPEVLKDNAHRLYRCTDTKGNEIVAGVWMDESSPLLRRGYYPEPVLLGIASQAKNIEMAVTITSLLLQG